MITKSQLRKYATAERKIPNKILTRTLMDKDPHCHWCKIPVYWYAEFRTEMRKGTAYPKNMATIDHLYDRYDPDNRYKVYKNGENKVLACYECNQKRCHNRNIEMGKEYITKRTLLGQKRAKEKSLIPRPLLYKDLV